MADARGTPCAVAKKRRLFGRAMSAVSATEPLPEGGRARDTREVVILSVRVKFTKLFLQDLPTIPFKVTKII